VHRVVQTVPFLELLTGCRNRPVAGSRTSKPFGSTMSAPNWPWFCTTAAKWWSCVNTVRSS
jgi:hypothetical protein